MKLGDLVRYRGWSKTPVTAPARPQPLGIVIEQFSEDSSFHHRIRVMWLGDKPPIQASILSTQAGMITSWVAPAHFEVISESSKSD
jgi:hypothetical protein